MKKAFVTIGLSLLVCGCANKQMLNNTTGNGANIQMVVPVPGTTASIISVGLQFGIYKNTALIQPVSTNKMYCASVAILSKTKQSDSIVGTAGETNSASATIAAGASDINAIILGTASVNGSTNTMTATGN